MAKPSRPSTDAKARTGSQKAQATEDKDQSARFLEMAKNLDADESGVKFEEAFKIVVPPKPPREN